MRKISNKIQYIIFLLFTLIVFIMLVKFFSESNIVNNKDVITISHESGFYDEPFYLTIKPNKKNIKIYYTTDCSNPTLKSAEYKEPILIKDATPNKNVYSARDDVYIKQFQDRKTVLDDSNKNILYVRIPNFPVDKANIVRISVYNKNTNQLLYKDIRTYYIGFNKKKGYKNLPVVSLILEPDDLLDNKKGIYVLGKNFSQNKIYEKNEDDLIDPFLTNANFYMKGSLWEKKVNVNIFDEKRNKIFSNNLLINIKGHLSRSFIQKSFKVFSNKKNEDLVFFNHNFHNEFILSSCATDMTTKILDYLPQTFEANANSNFLTLKMIPCILFLNGEYWGVYYITEDFSSNYISKNLDIVKNNIVIINKELNKPKFMINEDDFLLNSDMSKLENYNKAKQIIDIDSFIDYFATEMYLVNEDLFFGNFSYWKTKLKNKSNKYTDNKRRYLFYDMNHFSTMKDYVLDSFALTISKYPIFRSLLRNEEFRAKFKTRIFKLENEIYEYKKVEKFIDDYMLLMKEPLTMNNNRFYDTLYYDKLLDNRINKIKTFFKKRPEYINKYMEQYFAEFE